MKKLLLTFFILLPVLALCQEKNGPWQLNLGADVALPVFNMEINTIGGGADLKLIYKLSPKVDLTADAGFTLFLAKKEFVPTGLIPIRLGGAYWLKENIFLFAKTGLGIYMLYTPSETVTKNFWGIEVGPGFKLGKRTDLAFSYNGYQNKDGSFGFISARFGYFLKR